LPGLQISQWTGSGEKCHQGLNRPAFIDTLAAAYAEAGDFNNAVKWETQFLAMQNIDAGNHSDAQDRLALYQAKQPYHVVKFTPELGMAVLGDEARQN
jgi:SLT domain-containing protein